MFLWAKLDFSGSCGKRMKFQEKDNMAYGRNKASKREILQFTPPLMRHFLVSQQQAHCAFNCFKKLFRLSASDQSAHHGIKSILKSQRKLIYKNSVNKFWKEPTNKFKELTSFQKQNKTQALYFSSFKLFSYSLLISLLQFTLIAWQFFFVKSLFLTFNSPYFHLFDLMLHFYLAADKSR